MGDDMTNQIEVFNNRKNEWIVSNKKMPGTVEIAHHGMGVINETVYIFGGFHHDQSEGYYYASETYAYTGIPRFVRYSICTNSICTNYFY